MVMEEARLCKEDETLSPLPSLRNNLTMGRWALDENAEEIGGKFEKFGIPFSFSEFRHHQRGLVKAKNNSSILRRIFTETERLAIGSNGKTSPEAKTTYRASIEQGGHCIRTASLFYAQTATDDEEIELFRRASHEWHQDLGLRAAEQMSCPSTDDLSKIIANNNSSADIIQSSLIVAKMLSQHPQLTRLLSEKSPQELLRRLQTNRRIRENVVFRVVRLPNGQLQTLTDKVTQEIDAVRQKREKGLTRCLIICLTIEDAKAVRASIVLPRRAPTQNILLYHQDRNPLVKERVMKKWEESSKDALKILVATEGAISESCTVNVRLVIIAGASRGIADFWREASRAGRDGAHADVRLLFHESYSKEVCSGGADDQALEFISWVQKWGEETHGRP